MKTIPKWISAIGTIALLLLASEGVAKFEKVTSKHVGYGFIQVASEEAVAEMLATIAEKINQQVPIKISEWATLTRVIAVETLLSYVYEVNAVKSEVDVQTFKSSMRKTITANACEHMTKMLNSGASIIYLYMSTDGHVLAAIKVELHMCPS